MEPYGSNDLGTITSGTRQPPLDPLLGSLIQHLLGEGQLRQRLLPVAAGIGTLVLISLLLRRWCGGYAGPAAVLILATQPLMVRYSAYTRPYALPLFLMTLTWFAADRWLATGRWRWLVVAASSSALLPLARVPEPTVFLLASAVVLGWMAARGRLPRKRVVPLVARDRGCAASRGRGHGPVPAGQAAGQPRAVGTELLRSAEPRVGRTRGRLRADDGRQLPLVPRHAGRRRRGSRCARIASSAVLLVGLVAAGSRTDGLRGRLLHLPECRLRPPLPRPLRRLLPAAVRRARGRARDERRTSCRARHEDAPRPGRASGSCLRDPAAGDHRRPDRQGGG